MAFDRFVYFDGPAPSKEDLGKALEDYLGAGALAIKWERDRFFAQLHGNSLNPFRRLVDPPPYQEPDERWIEVVVRVDYVDVLTRHQDEFTNNIARGFARLVERFWKGRFEAEGGD